MGKLEDQGQSEIFGARCYGKRAHILHIMILAMHFISFFFLIFPF